MIGGASGCENELRHSLWIRLDSGKRALSWIYENHPAAPTKAVENRMYLVVAGPMHVFGLFAIVKPGQTETQVRRVLTRTLGTLAFSHKPINLEK